MMNIGIVGSGAMGMGIAQVAATAGHRVQIFDNNPIAAERAEGRLREQLQTLVAKMKITPQEANQILNRIQFIQQIEDLAANGMIIEAIVEDLQVKKDLFKQLDAIVAADCYLATNTSSLSITAIAATCALHPERVIGVHFFNPPPLMKLVEVIPALQTHEELTTRVRQLISTWGKKVVVAKDTPGFIVNRIARPFYSEALRILEEGIADIATIDWAMTQLGGFRMGPFALMDFIGHDVNYAVTESVFQAFFYDPRYRPSFTQKRLVEAGFLGKKTGRGFYNYQSGLIPTPLEDRELGQAIVERILAMLINEAVDALYLGVASREDIDLAMTLGANYPCGLIQWAEEIGIDICVERMNKLYSTYQEDRYRCSLGFKKLKKG